MVVSAFNVRETNAATKYTLAVVKQHRLLLAIRLVSCLRVINGWLLLYSPAFSGLIDGTFHSAERRMRHDGASMQAERNATLISHFPPNYDRKTLPVLVNETGEGGGKCLRSSTFVVLSWSGQNSNWLTFCGKHYREFIILKRQEGKCILFDESKNKNPDKRNPTKSVNR